MILGLVGVAALAPAATAAPADDITHRLEAIASASAQTPFSLPRFAFTGNLSVDNPGSARDVTRGLPGVAIADPKLTQAVMVDADTAWISTQLAEHYGCVAVRATIPPRVGCARPRCSSASPTAGNRSRGASRRRSRAARSKRRSTTASGRTSSCATRTARTTSPSYSSRRSATRSNLAATFSDRKETVLFGSELPERYAGAKAKATITSWNFSFVLRDGLRAGVSRSGTVAWLAANVDGMPHGSTSALPFRVFAIYEKTAAGWKVVQMQFATSV